MQNQINDIQDDVRQIKDALIGNDFGNKGIVKRLECNEKKTSENKKKITNLNSSSFLYGSGAGGGLLVIIETIKHFFGSGNH